MFILDDTNGSWQRAKDKASDEQPALETTARGSYSVKGSGGNRYSVTIRPDGKDTVIECTCLAGVHDRPCYHGAAAYAHYLSAAAAPVPASRDRRLGLVESDLRHIDRVASGMSGDFTDFERMDEICRAVRAALRSLGEYEVDLVPATVDMAA